MRAPEVQYAKSGDVSVAYQVVGEGDIDLVFVPLLGNMIWAWQHPLYADFYRQLASFSRLIRLDTRGTGLSDRPRELPTLETRMDDIRAVMDAAGSERAALLGAAAGGQLCAVFAATYPERTVALILHDTPPRLVSAPDYPAGEPLERWHERLRAMRASWGTRDYFREELRRVYPSLADNREFEDWYVSHERLAASPSAATTFTRMLIETDVRHVLPAIRVPTLVLYHDAFRAACLYVAEQIPGARALRVSTPDHGMYANAEVPAQIERFLRGQERVEVSERVLATLLFTDIVDSTARAATLGDARWRELVHAHHAAVRAELRRFRGEEVDTAGDGFFATFDGPARAVACANAVVRAAGELGLEVRAGVHTGECEVIGEKLGGIAVHTGARVAAAAEPGQVLVSSTVKDLVAGSGIRFEERGLHELKGVPGQWRLFAVSDDGKRSPPNPAT